MIQFFKVLTDFGGSNEFLLLVAVSFIFGTRSKCFYYLVCMMVDRVVNAYMKLVYHQPRPFMIDKEIISYSCSKGFGNPSGHSSAAWSFAIILFLDTFHGRSFSEK